MKKFLVLAVVVMLVLLSAGLASANEHHIKAELVPVGSDVRGFVQLVQMPHGGTRIQVEAFGLEPGATYTSFYYDGADCHSGADEIETYRANAAGRGMATGFADDDLDEFHSVSVREGAGYGTLLACASW